MTRYAYVIYGSPIRGLMDQLQPPPVVTVYGSEKRAVAAVSQLNAASTERTFMAYKAEIR